MVVVVKRAILYLSIIGFTSSSRNPIRNTALLLPIAVFKIRPRTSSRAAFFFAGISIFPIFLRHLPDL
ncbi:MAG: hypothetical protein BGP07_15905 [Rhizobiales bacterium 63-22]|nr:MAG: hypothetical protein BGP07_15905 [Rhizobiales bacterium 63-22]